MRGIRPRLHMMAVLCLLLVAVGTARAHSERATLQVLASQAFQKLHNEYVTLPNGTTERVARSTQDLPAVWPAGTLYGLVKAEYIENGLLSAGLSALDRGTFIFFRNDAEGFDVVIWFKRNARREIEITRSTAVVIGSGTVYTSPLTAGNPCDSTDDNQTCNCQGQDDRGGCDGANCGDAGVYQDTGEQDEHGNDVMENVDDGSQRVECGSAGPGLVVTSPR